MKRNIQKLVIAAFMLVVSLSLSAQEKTLVGKVTTFDSIPLIGVDIEVKSTGRTVQTDSLGRFQLFCDPTDKLKFEAKGFYPKKVKVQKDIRMILVNMNLKKGDNNLSQAEKYVNVGYGYVNSRDLLYAVSSASQKDIDFTKYDNVLDAVQGQFPGVSVEDGNIVVRGTKTFFGAQGNAALVVIDGAISTTQDLMSISPLDISSVNVLKDGSSSVYGSRGANGVVLVETKKGKQ